MLLWQEEDEARMKSTMLVLLVSIASLSLMSCGQPNKTTTADFPGTYVVKFSHGSETLVLKPDGTYEQKYVPTAGAATQTNTGKWELKTSPRPIVYLDDALLFDTRSNQPQIPPIRTVLGLSVRRWRNEIELVINDDAGLGYQKQSQATPPAAPK
jgi:hypothetical protein